MAKDAPEMAQAEAEALKIGKAAEFYGHVLTFITEISNINTIYARTIESVLQTPEIPLPVMAEALEDIANTYLNFAEILVRLERQRTDQEIPKMALRPSS